MALPPFLLDMMAQLAEHEGREPTPYKDTEDNWTVGVGHLMSKPLSAYAIDVILVDDIEEAWDGLLKALPWVLTLDTVRQRVLLDMAFNLGVKGLLGFRNTLRAVQGGRWADAAKGMLASKWARQVKGRARRLASMMETGHA